MHKRLIGLPASLHASGAHLSALASPGQPWHGTHRPRGDRLIDGRLQANLRPSSTASPWPPFAAVPPRVRRCALRSVSTSSTVSPSATDPRRPRACWPWPNRRRRPPLFEAAKAGRARQPATKRDPGWYDTVPWRAVSRPERRTLAASCTPTWIPVAARLLAEYRLGVTVYRDGQLDERLRCSRTVRSGSTSPDGGTPVVDVSLLTIPARLVTDERAPDQRSGRRAEFDFRPPAVGQRDSTPPTPI